MTGHRTPSKATLEKMQKSITTFACDLSNVKFA